MNSEFARLMGSWEQFQDLVRETGDWLEDAAGTSRRVAGELPETRNVLREGIRSSQVMLRACRANPGIGIFGPSQVGKSYLVSAFASSEDNKLHAMIGGQDRDFIREINPQGSGKESTGLVTRFTSDSRFGSQSRDFPVRLELLSEGDLVMILVNSYFSDFKDSQSEIWKERDLCRQRFQEFRLAATGKETVEGPDRDRIRSEIAAVSRYVKAEHPYLHEILGEEFWDHGESVVSGMDLEHRAGYYAILWNCLEPFTELFRKLAGKIAELGTGTFAASENALIRPQEQSRSIINVDALNLVFDPECPLDVKIRGESGRIQSINPGILAALTAEVVIPVRNPRIPMISHVDLLDFPGYRSRLAADPGMVSPGGRGTSGRGTSGRGASGRGSSGMGSTGRDASGREDETGARADVMQFFLRGKVSYLFQKYTDGYLMNALIVCTSADAQVENTDIRKVISSWISRTQGSDPQERSRRKSGFFWALTKFDKRISSDLDKDALEYGRSGLLHQTVLERFESEEWFRNWDGSRDRPQPFRNIILVRKPGTSDCAFMEKRKDSTVERGLIEKGIASQYKDLIDSMRSRFIRDDDVNRYVREPAEAWDAMISPNDGGLNRAGRLVEEVDMDSLKLSAVRRGLRSGIEEILRRIGKWVESDDDAMRQKKQKRTAIALFNYFKANQLYTEELGDILSLFTPDQSFIRNAYDNAMSANDLRKYHMDRESAPGGSGGAGTFGDSGADGSGVASGGADSGYGSSGGGKGKSQGKGKISRKDGGSGGASLTPPSSYDRDNGDLGMFPDSSSLAMNLTDEELDDFDFDMDAFVTPASAAPAEEASDGDGQTAPVQATKVSPGDRIYESWCRWLRELPGSIRARKLLPRFDPRILDLMAAEIITYSRQAGLREKLISQVELIERRTDRREHAAQVIQMAVAALISDFVFSCGDKLPRQPEAPLDKFGNPKLEQNVSDDSRTLFMKWFPVFKEVVTEVNAGSDQDHELTPGQNDRLRQLVNSFTDLQQRAE